MNRYTDIKSGRDHSLDVLRGLMLVIITVNHIGGPLKYFTFEPFGFVSAAEGFVYLSGLVFGLVYGKKLLNSPYKKVASKAYKRSAVIYFYHVLILIILLIPVILNPSILERLEASEIISSYHIDHPIRTVMAYSIFLVQPAQLDILPMYCLFILMAPFALKAFYYNRTVLVFVISLIVWLLAQYNWNIDAEKYELDFGHFNPFGWQILFFLGCYIGFLRARGKQILPTSKIILLATVLIFSGFMFVRYSPDNHGSLFNMIRQYTGRQDLGVLRFLNFLIMAYLINILIKKGWFYHSKWLATLGRHSLQVFAFQILLLYTYPLIRVQVESYGPVAVVATQCIYVSLLIIPARLHQLAVMKIPFVKKFGL